MTPERVAQILPGIHLHDGSDVLVFSPDGLLLGSTIGSADPDTLQVIGLRNENGSTIITDGLTRAWDAISGFLSATNDPGALQYDTE